MARERPGGVAPLRAARAGLAGTRLASVGSSRGRRVRVALRPTAAPLGWGVARHGLGRQEIHNP
eukprot:4700508-Prymnesium_polylepis.1